MSELLKIKQVDQLTETLALKALDADVVKRANNLSDVNATNARTNLSLYSKAEVDGLLVGAKDAYNVADLAARNALVALKITDRVFVNDDGDGKWALYLVTAITNGSGATSTFKKIADEDLFTNALSAAAVKASYESNADTYAFNGTYKSKLDKITIASVIDLDVVKSTANTALANAATAQTAANSANAAASAAQTTANTGVAAAAAAQTSANNAANAAATAQAIANGKEDSYIQVTENFSALLGAASTDVMINLSHPSKAGHALQVFFNGLRVKNVTNLAGSTQVIFRVPYVTDATDDISITYAY